MKMMLSAKQWEKIEDKYGLLMHKISHNISGDNAISSHEDNLQDIKLAAMEAVIGFEKQHEGANGKFDDFWGSKGFDQYIKTCMWTKKNNKGSKIEKNYSITKRIVNIHENEEVLNLRGSSGSSIENCIFVDEINMLIDEEQQRVVKSIVNNPKLIKRNGKINILQLSRELNKGWADTKKTVKELSRLMKNEL